MFAGNGSWVARFRWPVLIGVLVTVISAGVWGLGVFGHLAEGGYTDPNSESSHAAEAARQAFGEQSGDVVAIYTPTGGQIDDPALSQRIIERLAALPTTAVANTTSYWQRKSPQYAAADRSSAVAVITLVGPDDPAKLAAYHTIDDKFGVDGATVRLAGNAPLANASTERSAADLASAEVISLPIVLILLLFIFGSLVAAALPVLVGGAAVLGSLGILNVVAGQTAVDSFAVNVASLLGLGMAIDYGLFMVGRFREEQAAGRTPAEAVGRTLATAGRTVLFSASLLMIALAGLLLFPQGFLKSLAYGGLAAVGLAAVLSLTLLPAMLAILGPRVDRLPVRLPRRKDARPAGTLWGRLAALVLRRPVLVAVPIIAGLLVLAAPTAGVHFGESDERVLPKADPSRQAVETIKRDYPQFNADDLQVVLRGSPDANGFAAAVRAIPGVTAIGEPRQAGNTTELTVVLGSTDPFSSLARDTVTAIRALPVPAGTTMLVGGTTARNIDSLHAIAAKLPLMISLLVGATLVLMFLAFGSILLPIKAVVTSALSLSATFGTLVWIFQDGHLAGLFAITPAPLEAGIVVLMAAVVFGLSTDYEVFLLSRMVEARDRGATTAEAVTTGLARTGRVISAAAILLIVVTGAFALSSVTTMRFVGIGMITALLLDATVVRMLLVPAVLSLLGDAAWWAPSWLRWARIHHSDQGPWATTSPVEETRVLTGQIYPRPLALTGAPSAHAAGGDAPTRALAAPLDPAATLMLPAGITATLALPAGLTSTPALPAETMPAPETTTSLTPEPTDSFAPRESFAPEALTAPQPTELIPAEASMLDPAEATAVIQLDSLPAAENDPDPDSAAKSSRPEPSWAWTEAQPDLPLDADAEVDERFVTLTSLDRRGLVTTDENGDAVKVATIASTYAGSLTTSTPEPAVYPQPVDAAAPIVVRRPATLADHEPVRRSTQTPAEPAGDDIRPAPIRPVDLGQYRQVLHDSGIEPQTNFNPTVPRQDRGAAEQRPGSDVDAAGWVERHDPPTSPPVDRPRPTSLADHLRAESRAD